MKTALKAPLNKKELKRFVSENGFFCSTTLDLSKNAPDDIASKIPEGATYFEGVVSNGELNRNGYIIRPQALIDSLAIYMENPIILLQHNMNRPVGQNIGATMRGEKGKEEIFVQGFVFDDMTDGAFGRGLLRALSTGHITLEVEFENVKTGEIKSVEEFRAMRDEMGYFGDWEEEWVMAVTKLEWVEYSLVSIPSNRKSLITKKNAIEAYFSEEKFSEKTLNELAKNEEGEEEKSEEKKEDQVEEKKEEEQKTEAPTEGDGAENSGEKPEAKTEETAEKSGEGEGATESEGGEEGQNKIKISKADREKLQAMSAVLIETLEATVAAEEDGEKEEEKEEMAEDKAEEKAEQSKTETSMKAVPAEGEEALEGEAAKLEVAPEVKNALLTLVTINTQLEKEVHELKTIVSKIPNLKGLAIISQFPLKGEEAKKLPEGEALLGILRETGFNV